MTGGRPGANDMQRLPTLGAIAGVAQGFAVDGDVPDAQRLGESFYPLVEARLERLGIDAVEDAFQRVVGGKAVGQTEKLLEPGTTATGKGGDLLPVVGPGDHSTDG